MQEGKLIDMLRSAERVCPTLYVGLLRQTKCGAKYKPRWRGLGRRNTKLLLYQCLKSYNLDNYIHI